MDAIPYVDKLVSEYLLFRGFTTTFQAFNSEKSADRGCGYQAEQISNLIFGRLIPKHDGRGLVDLLSFLKTQVFSKLDSDLESSAAKIEVSPRYTRKTMLRIAGNSGHFSTRSS